jgi:hypothetical protein
MDSVAYPHVYDVTPIFHSLSLKGLREFGAPKTIEIRGAMLAFIWNVKTPMEDSEVDDATDLIEITLVYDPSNDLDWSIDFYSHETLEEYGVDPIKLEEINDVLVNCILPDTMLEVPITITGLKAYCEKFVA